MVQSVAPAKTLQTVDGYIAGVVCSPEMGCVRTQAMVCLRIDEDGEWVLAFHDPTDPMRGMQLTGVAGENCERLREVVTALGLLAPVPAQP